MPETASGPQISSPPNSSWIETGQLVGRASLKVLSFNLYTKYKNFMIRIHQIPWMEKKARLKMQPCLLLHCNMKPIELNGETNQSFKMVNNPSRVSTCWFVHSRRVQSIPLNIAMESSKLKNEATKSSSCSPSLNRLIEHDGHKLWLVTMGDTQSYDRSRAFLLYVEVVEDHILRQWETARIILARWKAQ